MKFEYSPRILAQLGTELITSDEVAFTELLKNAYDAKATVVNVHFLESIDKLDVAKLLTPLPDDVLAAVKAASNKAPVIIIEDNGKGMDYNELQNGFFKVGSDLKEQQKRKDENDGSTEKMILGDKGLGRLSSQRLAATLLVETSSKGEKDLLNLVTVNWSKFAKDLDEDAPELRIKKLTSLPYTRLWFTGGVNFSKFIDDRRPEQISMFEEPGEPEIYLQEKLQSSVSFLYSPFEQEEDDFKINFFLNGLHVQSSFHNDSIKVAETIHSFSLNRKGGKSYLELELQLKPWYVEMIHLRLLGKNLFKERQRDAAFYESLLEKYQDRLQSNLSRKMKLEDYLESKQGLSQARQAIEQIMPVEGKVYAFHREAFRLNLAINSAKATGAIEKTGNMAAIRDFLNYHNGIKLYRDKFRIANLGDKESDWLSLQQARTRGQQFFRFELGNVVGYIKINDFYQNFIKEISSRQELVESLNAIALKRIVQAIFNDDFYQLSTSAYYLVRDILIEEGLVRNNTPKELKQQVDESEALLQETLKSLAVFQAAFKDIKDNIHLNSDDSIQKVRKILLELEGQDSSLSDSINNSISTLKNAKETLTVIEERQRDSYNNYKLMANGLITEVMTHELHSILLNTKSGEGYQAHIASLKNYLFDQNQVKRYNEELKPVAAQLDFLHTRITELDVFYNFLESTFIRQGTSDDFEHEDFGALLEGFKKRLDTRLKDSKTMIVYDGLKDYTWYVPKGTLTHVFYNLIDNSLHWIGERQKRSAYDQSYKLDGRDFIRIEKVDDYTVNYYDSGTGVQDDLQYTLFHPFKSGKENGRGMGLYIVKNLLESFGGSINLLPDLNSQGNRYIFSISIQNDEQA
ncbi:MAG: ATP-binding protein [Bacteroidetes bacterium]|nr:ATP-binding protein [Bacteroidota bacterium]